MRQVNDEEDDYRSRAAMHRKEKLAKGLFKLPEGETVIRILKTPKDEERNSPSVWIEYYVHRNVGPKKLTNACGKSVIDDSGACWLCKVVLLLKEKGKSKLASLLEKQKVYAVQVAVMDEDIGGLRGPLLWPMASGKTAKSLSFKVETIVASKKDYLNHKHGYNFTFERTGTGMLDTAYGKTERDDEPSSVPQQIIAKLKPFADVVLQYDPEAQKQAYYGKRDEDEEEEAPKRKSRPVDDEDEDEPKPKHKAPVEDDEEEEAPKKKKPVTDDDEEEEAPPKKKKPATDDDDEAYLNDDEEEEKPKKKKPVTDDDEEEEAPPKKKKPPVEDEDEEEPAPKKKKPAVEDEEEEAPPKKKKPAADDDEDLSFPDEEEEEGPKPKKKKPVADDLDDDLDEAPPKKKKPAADDEDADEGEPAPKKKKKPADEDEELEFPEDEEEPAPKKKKKPVADEDEEE